MPPQALQSDIELLFLVSLLVLDSKLQIRSRDEIATIKSLPLSSALSLLDRATLVGPFTVVKNLVFDLR
jgi:hypothetical protein